MTWQGWASVVVVVAVFVALQRRRGAGADFIFTAALCVVSLLGIISPTDAFLGFANPAVLTIAALFVIAAGMRRTGALDLVGDPILRGVRHESQILRRLAAPVVAVSALINNTPLVAMLVPMLLDWCRKHEVSPSRLLIPLSYLAILGGTCTLIGTSTNLVVNAMLLREHDRLKQQGGGDAAATQLAHQMRGMHLFEIGYVGIPCALVGSAYLLLIGRRRLPNRTELIESLGESRREFLTEIEVQPGSRIIGKSVEAAGLRHLPGLFLIEIDRAGEVITPAQPTHVIHGGDRLVFTGVVSTIVDLEKVPGLRPVGTPESQDDRERLSRGLTEVVLSNSSPVIGRTVREASFRQLYNAAIVAVHRSGKRLTSKIGDIRLQSGDTLLLQTPSNFVDAWRNNPDFFLVSSVQGYQPSRHSRAGVALVLMVVLVAAMFASVTVDPSGAWRGFSSTAVLAVSVAGLMVALRCLSGAEARAAVDLPLLVTIGSALGLGLALQESGAAKAIASGLLDVVGQNSELLLLLFIFLLTLVFTELITNVGVAALMFPLAVQVSQQIGCSPRPFVMAVALAASTSFLTPIGYQTNLMVFGPGGYRPGDYLKAGFPLTVLVTITALVVIPIAWPFHP